jgi:hypothetical protein
MVSYCGGGVDELRVDADGLVDDVVVDEEGRGRGQGGGGGGEVGDLELGERQVVGVEVTGVEGEIGRAEEVGVEDIAEIGAVVVVDEHVGDKDCLAAPCFYSDYIMIFPRFMIVLPCSPAFHTLFTPQLNFDYSGQSILGVLSLT